MLTVAYSQPRRLHGEARQAGARPDPDEIRRRPAARDARHARRHRHAARAIPRAPRQARVRQFARLLDPIGSASRTTTIGAYRTPTPASDRRVGRVPDGRSFDGAAEWPRCEGRSEHAPLCRRAHTHHAIGRTRRRRRRTPDAITAASDQRRTEDLIAAIVQVALPHAAGEPSGRRRRDEARAVARPRSRPLVAAHLPAAPAAIVLPLEAMWPLGAARPPRAPAHSSPGRAERDPHAGPTPTTTGANYTLPPIRAARAAAQRGAALTDRESRRGVRRRRSRAARVRSHRANRETDQRRHRERISVTSASPRHRPRTSLLSLQLGTERRFHGRLRLWPPCAYARTPWRPAESSRRRRINRPSSGSSRAPTRRSPAESERRRQLRLGADAVRTTPRACARTGPGSPEARRVLSGVRALEPASRT